MAISAAMVWDVRLTGLDTNGGGFRGGCPLSTPSAPGVSGSTTGGTVAANTYYVVVTLTDGNGETPGSPQASVTTTGATSSITVTHPTDPVSQGSTWNVYVGTVSGGPYFSQGTGLLFTANRAITTTPPTTGTQAPGVDYSQQDAPQFALTTASTVHTTTTQVNVAAGDHTVSAADLGNVLNNTGGTATVQRLEITGIDIANNRWTVDKAAGTSGQTMTGVVGGALASPGMAGAVGTSGNGLFIRYNASNYSCSSSANVSGGNLSSANFAYIVGYQTTRDRNNADANRPTLAAANNSMTILLSSKGVGTVVNLVVDGSGRTAITGLAANGNTMTGLRCKAVNCATTGLSMGTGGAFVGCSAVGCGVGLTGSVFFACTAINCTGIGFSLGGGGNALSCVASGCGGSGFVCTATFNLISNCVAYNNANGFVINNSGPNAVLFDCVAYLNATVGFVQSSTPSNVGNSLLVNGAVGANGTDIGVSWKAYQISGLLTLTTDPFTNAAGLDFSPNNLAGGGFVLRGAGYPSVMPGLATTWYPDVGVQHSDASVPQGPTGRVAVVQNIGTY